MKTIYLVAAITGAVVPNIFFAQHLSVAGFGPANFVAALFENSAAGGFTADLLISSCVFWLFMLHRNRFAHGPTLSGSSR